MEMNMIESAGIFIFDVNGKLLVCIPKGGAENSKGLTIPKGKLDSGETPLMAALRETKEECGLDLYDRIDKLHYIGCKNYKHKKKRLHAFILTINSKHENIGYNCQMIDDRGRKEIEGYQFITEAEYDKLHIVQKEIMEEWNAKNKNWD
jgi:8-oxo-dGTP pyrophosphatase MutT (NUDIX family)